LFWQIFSFFILGLGISILLEKPQRRKAFRVNSNDEAFVFTENHTFSGRVRDISLTGIWIETDQDITEYLKLIRDNHIKVMIKDLDNIAFYLDAKVVNANSKNIRAQFLKTNELVNIAKLVKVVYADSSRWEIFREELTMGPIRTSIFLTKLFFKTFSKSYTVATKEFLKEMKQIDYKSLLYNMVNLPFKYIKTLFSQFYFKYLKEIKVKNN
ncbi:MAG: PilZ domain-containing protein, partial [Sulfurihydrogenibium azorense]